MGGYVSMYENDSVPNDAAFPRDVLDGDGGVGRWLIAGAFVDVSDLAVTGAIRVKPAIGRTDDLDSAGTIGRVEVH